MFLFESIPWYSALMWFVVLGGLMLANQLARMSKWFSLVVFIAVPVVLTIFVWPDTAGEGSSVGSWFHWVKVYSALAGCLGFMAIRFIKGWKDNRYILLFPPIILAVNIAEAVFRDFQVSGMNGIVDGVMTIGGPWNILNGIAGILNMVTLSGWMAIVISKDRYKDMVWPDQTWFWIAAYVIWNFTYVYACVSDHSFYAGAALLASCTIPAFFFGKGAWLQHRAQTLAFWMMFTMSFPAFVHDSKFAVQSSHSETALWVMAILSLAVNLAVFIYHFYKIIKYKRNLFKEPIHSDLASYKAVAERA